jgi:fructokinase
MGYIYASGIGENILVGRSRCNRAAKPGRTGEMTKSTIVIGLGEALWDVLPGGKVLGGAPLNVACHVHSILRGSSCRDETGEAIVASRVGADALGDEVIRELERRGMSTEYVQRDAAHPTSTVNVSLAAGQPTYTFASDIAWDHLEFSPAWAKLAARCDAVCFGTLAQRSQPSREVIWKFLDAAPQAIRLFDVNLRQGFFDEVSILEGCRSATLIKLNEQELPIVVDCLKLPAGESHQQLRRIIARFQLDAAILTRGSRGTLLVLPDEVIDPPPATYPAAANADAVGAGDACSAAVLVGFLLKLSNTRIAALANHLGAYVASQPGATPEIPLTLVRMFD